MLVYWKQAKLDTLCELIELFVVYAVMGFERCGSSNHVIVFDETQLEKEVVELDSKIGSTPVTSQQYPIYGSRSTIAT